MTIFWTSWYTWMYNFPEQEQTGFKYWTTGYGSRDRVAPDGLSAGCGLSVEDLTDKLYVEWRAANPDTGEDEFHDKVLIQHVCSNASICAAIEAEDEDAVWAKVAKHFPDYEERFIEDRPEGWTPGSRFQ